MKTNNTKQQDSSDNVVIHVSTRAASRHTIQRHWNYQQFGLRYSLSLDARLKPSCMTAALGNLPKVLRAYEQATFGRLSVLLLLLPALLFAQAPTIVSFTPTRNALNVEKDANITVTFDTDINQSTINNSTVKINGSLSGLHNSTFSYSSLTYTATIDPNSNFQIGEVVTVTLTCGIKSASDDSVLSAFCWSFTIKVDDGSGHFVQTSLVSVVGDDLYSIIAGDWNGDGSLDLAVKGNPTTFSIMLNNGRGLFTQGSTLSIEGTWVFITAGDWNGDGFLDVAVPGTTVLLNNGNGTFTQSSTGTGGGSSITYGDWNGDGSLDLATSEGAILFNQGNGTFTQSSVANVGSQPIAIIAGDWNGDGSLDLAVTNNSGTITILMNNGNGDFTQDSTISVGFTSYSITAGDWNGDGSLDLALISSLGTVLILMNNGSGLFTQSSTVSVEVNSYIITGGDWNGDGFFDLVVANTNNNTISILMNNGSGDFTQCSTVSVGITPYTMATGDWNGDGFLDLAVANHDGTVSILFNYPSNATLRLSSALLNFDEIRVGNSKSKYLTIYNNGIDSSLVISSITSSNAAFTVNRISLIIPTSGTDSVLVTFAPVEEGIVYSDSLAITSNDLNKPIVHVYVTGSSPPAVPILVSPLDSAIGVSSYPTLTWNTVPLATSYHLQVSTDSLLLTMILNDSSIIDTMLQISSLFAGTEYFWHVSSQSLSGISNFSETWSFVTKNPPPIIFTSTLNGPIYAGLSLLGDSLLYAVATGDAVYRIDYNGNKVYDLQVGGTVRSSSSIGYDTTVYIGSSDKNLYAFNKNGVPVWAPVPLGGELSATPTIDSLLNRLYIGVSNKNFFGINRRTGVVDWSLFADAPIQQSAVLTSDRKLVFTTTKGTIYGIDLTAQSEPTSATWTLSLSDTITSSPAIDMDGNFYAGTYNGKIIKVSLPQGSDAQIVWQVQTGGTITASPIIDSKGTVYVGSSDKKLYALNGATGNIKWTFTTSDKIHSTAALSNSGVVYVANDAGEVFALDSAASIRWYYKDSSSISAPLLFQKGTLYLGTESGKIVALYDGEDVGGLPKTIQSLAVPIWGTFQGNNQRNGAQHIAGAVVARIYPGDANNDGIVDVRDILPIGRFYATTGAPRQNASSNWSVQSLTSAWNPFNACYADCDGNGTVDAQDANVILQNWQAKQGEAAPKVINRCIAAQELLKAIDSQSQSEAMKAIRSSIVNYMQKNLEIVFTFSLSQNYPNPFNPTTTIRFVLPEATTMVKLTIYNILGQCVFQTDICDLDAGDHFFEWNGTSFDGIKVASGIYIYRLEAGKYMAQHRMILLK
jgi:outer membrane protein assembly factor BamB